MQDIADRLFKAENFVSLYQLVIYGVAIPIVYYHQEHAIKAAFIAILLDKLLLAFGRIFVNPIKRKAEFNNKVRKYENARL